MFPVSGLKQVGLNLCCPIRSFSLQSIFRNSHGFDLTNVDAARELKTFGRLTNEDILRTFNKRFSFLELRPELTLMKLSRTSLPALLINGL